MRKKKVEDSIVKEVNCCTNQITLEDMNTGIQYEVHGDAISDEVKVGSHIYNIIGD